MQEKKAVPGIKFIYTLVELDFCRKLQQISSAKQSSIPRVSYRFDYQELETNNSTRKHLRRNNSLKDSTMKLNCTNISLTQLPG